MAHRQHHAGRLKHRDGGVAAVFQADVVGGAAVGLLVLGRAVGNIPWAHGLVGDRARKKAAEQVHELGHVHLEVVRTVQELIERYGVSAVRGRWR